MAQVNCTKVFLFNPHPISVFPKGSIFMPALHTYTPVSFSIRVAAPFPVIIILSIILKCTSLKCLI